MEISERLQKPSEKITHRALDPAKERKRIADRHWRNLSALQENTDSDGFDGAVIRSTERKKNAVKKILGQKNYDAAVGFVSGKVAEVVSSTHE